MLPLIYLCGVLFLLYGMSIFLIILIKNCSLSEARSTLTSFFKENSYSLSNDINYIQELNKIIRDIIGQERYDKLVILEEHSRTIFFEDNSSGLACVNIVVSIADDNEKIQIQTLAEAKTQFYLSNYKINDIVTNIEWDKSTVFGYPMLKITYPRNEEECKRIQALKNVEINNIISSSNDIIDDSEDLL